MTRDHITPVRFGHGLVAIQGFENYLRAPAAPHSLTQALCPSVPWGRSESQTYILCSTSRKMVDSSSMKSREGLVMAELLLLLRDIFLLKAAGTSRHESFHYVDHNDFSRSFGNNRKSGATDSTFGHTPEGALEKMESMGPSGHQDPLEELVLRVHEDHQDRWDREDTTGLTVRVDYLDKMVNLAEMMDGTDGMGRDGKDGKGGKDGIDDTPGPPGAIGPRGRDGTDGVRGPPGQDGRDGTNGLPGPAGLNGRDGRDFHIDRNNVIRFTGGIQGRAV
uniref:Collagen alpha-3(VI) chain n=1 Tax=Talaromyces marneffei PM1 TaxID=1077442 RepID=A0A093UUL6_TALMA